MAKSLKPATDKKPVATKPATKSVAVTKPERKPVVPATKPERSKQPVRKQPVASKPDASLSPALKSKLSRLGFELAATASTLKSGASFAWLGSKPTADCGLWLCTDPSNTAEPVVFAGGSARGLGSRLRHVLQMADASKTPAFRTKQRGVLGAAKMAKANGTTTDNLVNKWDNHAGDRPLLLIHIKPLSGDYQHPRDFGPQLQAVVDELKPRINRTVALGKPVEPEKPAAKPAAVTAKKPAGKPAKPAAVTVKPATKKPAGKPAVDATAELKAKLAASVEADAKAAALKPAGKLVKRSPVAKPEPVKSAPVVTVVPAGKRGKPAPITASITAKSEPKAATRARIVAHTTA